MTTKVATGEETIRAVRQGVCILDAVCPEWASQISISGLRRALQLEQVGSSRGRKRPARNCPAGDSSPGYYLTPTPASPGVFILKKLN
ncbi:MAG: hypothetical protein COV31_02060 [Candidatus Yanofskybacteria bacterium CG10_big_fil_rev_8_21_14_0_10_46_23]|uniref:Uncharacterized protein n=1 Tax=Candidatus Yanofskybacteria bacterium CG10_big_fil_rev_8_21_14_0_10_46_23 TaxID=1975098 RepID=A0A2H0R3T9_9BACT|nr:MAG: hypothetical protein COV31_02060 [Candidatus Yanofskybacteria bacterium CG10_big_fil_rev_8_21_14_0_10_46_23]